MTNTLIRFIAPLIAAFLAMVLSGCGRDKDTIFATAPSEHSARWVEVNDGPAQADSLHFSFDTQIYPNPFNPVTIIQFSLPNPGIVTLTIYDGEGNTVTTLLSGELLDDGAHEVEWDASNQGTGVYLFQLVYQGVDQDGRPNTGVLVSSKKMMLLK